MKLGSSGGLSHELPSENWLSTQEATLVVLMEMIDELAPQVVEHLHDEVLPAYPDRPGPFGNLEVPEQQEAAWTILKFRMHPKWIGLPSKERQEFEAVLLNWKQRFNLDCWTSKEFAYAFDARVELLLFYWSQAEDKDAFGYWYRQSPLFQLAVQSKKKREWGSFARKSWGDPTQRNQTATPHLVSWALSEEEGPPVDRAKLRPPRLPLFDPLEMTQTEYIERVKQLAKEHAQEISELHELLGAQKPKRKANLDHFRWLVRYQVLNMPLADICNLAHEETGEALEDASIQRAVHRTAKLIGLELARGQGRPRKADTT